MAFSEFFLGTVVGFVLCALLVVSAQFPKFERRVKTAFRERVTRGVHMFWPSRQLHGLMW